MRACFLSYDGLSDPLGGSQIWPYVAGLAEAGHDMTLVSFEKADRYAAQGAELHRIAEAAGVKWLPQRYHRRPPVLSTLGDLLTMRRTLWREHEHAPFELIHVRSYLPMEVAINYAQRTGARLLFDMRGFWADERVEGGLWPQLNPLYRAIYRYFKRAEQRYVRAADSIVSLTEAGAQVLRTWPGYLAAPKPITVIPCSADFEHFSLVTPAAREAARRELSLPIEALVLGYLGAIGTWYRLPEMLRLVRLAMDRNEDVYFLVLTAEDPEMVFEEAGKQAVPKERVLVRRASRAEVPRWMAAANVGLSFIQPSFSKTASSPTKLGELLAMGIPVLVNAQVGDVEAIVTRVGGGRVLPDLSEASLSAAADSLPSLLALSPAQLRAAALPIYDLARARASYAQVYAALSASVAASVGTS
jgi:glycosyltransferase involved in cell wall biosynthesis